jgi:uncharacterized protein (TIGR00730 family)
MKRVCVYSGSSSGARADYLDAARDLGRTLADRGIGLVYGGAHVGLMGAVADAALAAGGDVIGVIPQSLVDKEVAHRGLPDLRIVHSMHERKALMADLSDAFVALPGGWGTLEELFETVTWAQLGLHQKPCGLLNVSGYFDDLLSFVDHAVREGFLHPSHAEALLVAESPSALLAAFDEYRPATVAKWIDRAGR